MKKDIGIPNSYPYKEQLLEEIQQKREAVSKPVLAMPRPLATWRQLTVPTPRRQSKRKLLQRKQRASVGRKTTRTMMRLWEMRTLPRPLKGTMKRVMLQSRRLLAGIVRSPSKSMARVCRNCWTMILAQASFSRSTPEIPWPGIRGGFGSKLPPRGSLCFAR